MSAHWLDRTWQYQNAASHNGDGFRRRQRERVRAAEAQRKQEAAARQEKVTKIRKASA